MTETASMLDPASRSSETDYVSAVALIGMSGRFPGAASPAELWRNLLAGVKGLRELTDDELRAAGVDPGQLADPRYVRIGGPVSDLDKFDASVFGVTPREAETMDPQHRLFLECTWEALESAGYCPTDLPGQVGVFAGCGFPDYIVQNIGHVAAEPGGALLLAVGNERDSLASLVSYKLGLRGPAIGVQTFCSTSLVSVHLACQSLLTYECDIALAGGAYVPLPQPTGYVYEPGGITSPDGQVRSFDAEASGTVMGSGVGAVALKRMSEALSDGDVIHAVILGSAANNDGRNRAGYTAPGVDGQAEVIESALGVAGVKPDTIGYVECHATATVLGDSIELAAMNRVFNQARENPCVLGSLKPSLGHLDRASGVSGLIRASLNLKHELLPATPNYANPNPALATAQDRFTVLTEHRPWPDGPHPRRAGVSSFGLGGTNAHVVLEQAPSRPARPHRPGPHLLTFSANDDRALAEVTERLREHIAAHPDEDLADVAFTLQVSRGGFALRRAVVVHDRDDAVAALADPNRWIDGKTQRRNPKVRLISGDSAERLAGLGIRLVRDESEADVEIAVEPGQSGFLAALAGLWQAGSAVDWAALHGGAGRRVELPTYPFQRRTYWVEARPSAFNVPDVWWSAGKSAKAYDRAQWTYLPTWRQRPLPVRDLDERLRLAGPWLVFTADERGDALVERLTGCGAEVIAVRPGEAFGQDEVGDFTVRVDEPEDMAELLRSLVVSPRAIVHAFSLAGTDGGFAAGQRHGFYSALALAANLVDDSGSAGRVELILLTSGAVGVTGTDLAHPEHATLAALGPSLAQENPRLRCRHIDVDAGGSIAQALAAAVTEHEGPVAVRAGETWLRTYAPYPIEELEDKPVRPGETVLITGGLGDVGLVLAKHLAGEYGCKLVLTARSPLPPREHWARFLEAVPEGSERIARHVGNILELERLGADVLAMSADVSDVDAMRTVVDAAVDRFGGIDVVVHGAGVQDGRFFNFAHLMDRDQCDAHFAAKVGGFEALQEVLGEHAKDRRITMSSLAAVLGGMTLAPYAAANAALDAYARVARASGAGKWITVNWDTWNIDPERLEGHGPTVRDFAMVPAEAVDVFERTLSAGDRVGHLVISTGSLDTRIAQWVTGDIHGSEDEEADDARERHPRPELNNPYVEPRERTETTLAEIWGRVLGIEPIGVTDNFFELGGHSLLAIDLTARIRKALGAAIPITGLLECPTVRQLAELIDANGGGEHATA